MDYSKEDLVFLDTLDDGTINMYKKVYGEGWASALSDSVKFEIEHIKGKCKCTFKHEPCDERIRHYEYLITVKTLQS